MTNNYYTDYTLDLGGGPNIITKKFQGSIFVNKYGPLGVSEVSIFIEQNSSGGSIFVIIFGHRGTKLGGPGSFFAVTGP